MTNVFTIDFLLRVIRLITPILFASLGSFVAASTGIGNIAIEGIMTMGALMGIIGSYLTKSAFLGLLIGVLTGVLMALLIAFFSMRLGANATLVGIALNTFSSSLAAFILYQFTGEKGTSAKLFAPTFGSWDIPIIKDIPIIGQLLSGHLILVYVVVIAAILLYIFLYKTPTGLRMRSCGLNADAAKTAGINVERLQILSLILSGILASLGGIYLSMNYSPIYTNGIAAGLGWMGIAANGIASGSYGILMLATAVFGVFRSIAIILAGKLPVDLVGAVPYFAVLVVIVALAVIQTVRTKQGKVAEQ